MGDVYQFPVFFRCNDQLLEEQFKKIEKYFRIKRKSGGGECGSLKMVDDQIYSIAFKYQKEQQAVLLRSEHVVDGVAFTVRDRIELCTSSPATPSAEGQGAAAWTSYSSHSDLVVTQRRIILLGKTGAGKSSLANTIFGETLFNINHSPNSGTNTSTFQVGTRLVSGRNLTLIETPGFFDSEKSEEELKPEFLRCFTVSAPGPHAFLIVLKVEKYTEQEQAVIDKICQHFSDDALKYAVIVFTHGDQLPEEMKVEEYVRQNENLDDLVKRCGGRCHVVDNRYWKNSEEDGYRYNQFQVAELLNTLDKMAAANQGGYYNNELLQAVNTAIQKTAEDIRQSSGNMSQEEIRNKAVLDVSNSLLIQAVGFATGLLVATFLGAPGLSGISRAVVFTTLMTGLKGGVTGYEAAEGAKSPREAVHKAMNAAWKK